MRYGTNSVKALYFFLKEKKKAQVSRWEMREGITVSSRGKETGIHIIQEHNIDHSLTGLQVSNRIAREDKLEGKGMK